MPYSSKSIFCNPLIPEARKLYLSGLSTRKVGKLVGVNCSTIYHWLKDEMRPHLKPESKHWRTNRNRSRKLMEKHLSRKLTSNEAVHHINKDFTDNRLENLKVLSRSEHAKLHFDKGKGFATNPKQYWANYRATHREYLRELTRNYRRKYPERLKTQSHQWYLNRKAKLRKEVK